VELDEGPTCTIADFDRMLLKLGAKQTVSAG
jgi:hypothetical protein